MIQPKQVICFESEDGRLFKKAADARDHDLYRKAKALFEPFESEFPAYEAAILIRHELQELFDEYKDILEGPILEDSDP